MRGPALLLALVALSCGGDEATLQLTLVFPPGQDRLPAEAVTVRLTLVDDSVDFPEVVEAPVAADGSFDLVLAVAPLGAGSVVIFEALDVAGTAIAFGSTPPLPVGLIGGTLTIYVGRPGAFTEAPFTLDPPLTDVAVVPQDYGFLLAGGVDAAGVRSAQVLAYSAYLHEPTPGEDLPEPRSAMTAAAGSLGLVYLFGGVATGGVETAALTLFDTTVAPDGEYTDLATEPGLARAGADHTAIGGDRFLVTGDPVVLIDGPNEQAVAMENAPSAALTATAAATALTDEGTAVAVLAGADSAALYDAAADVWTTITVPSLDGTISAVSFSGADVLVFATSRIVRITPFGEVFELAAGPFPDARAVVTLGQFVIAAGGVDATGAVVGEATIYGTFTAELMEIATTPLLVPRTGAKLVRLPNATLALVGGRDADGNPVGVIEIFTAQPRTSKLQP